MSPQVSKTRLSILVDLENDVVWIVSTCPLISKSSSPFTKPLGLVPSVHYYTPSWIFQLWLRDSKFPQVYRTLLSILADLNWAVAWMVSILVWLPSSATLFSRPLWTISCAPTMIGNSVSFKFHIFFSSLAKFRH